LVRDLSEEQVQSLRLLSGEGGFASLADLADVPLCARELRLYASLSAAQQQLLWRGGVLPVSQLTPAQRRLFEPALRQHIWGTSPPTSPDQIQMAGLSLMKDRLIRVRQQRGESVTLTDEPAPSPAAAVQGGTPPSSRSDSPSQKPATASPSIRRYPVIRLAFLVRVGSGGFGRGALVIPAPDGPL
jgi:hypothetical protein